MYQQMAWGVGYMPRVQRPTWYTFITCPVTPVLISRSLATPLLADFGAFAF